MFRKMPFILLALILLIGGFGQWISPFYQSILYGMSLSIKSLIVFILPLIVFGLLFKSGAHFAHQASKMILFIVAAICCSNFISTLLSYSVGNFAYQLDISMHFPLEAEALQPIWEFSFPKWIGNGQAMISGLLLGVILTWIKPSLAQTISARIGKVINILLKGILFIIPLFIAGFVVKMHHDRVMSYIFHNYALIFALIASAVFIYIALLYLMISRYQSLSFMTSLKNMLPAAIAGFGSMSSAAAMPLTILGTEKNVKNREMARSIIPATVNIHLIGDCFAIPIFAFAVMKGFQVAEPSFVNYLLFASFFVLAKFSVAAVPGGGILVMLPILENYLGFQADMLSMITALYILFDPVITCANVLGNGAFAMGVDGLFSQSISSLQEVAQQE